MMGSMGYRVRPDGVVEADTLDEVGALLTSRYAPRGPLRAVVAAAAAPVVDVAAALASLPEPQRALLRHVRARRVVSLAALAREFGLRSNNAVTGIVSGIVKNLRRLGIDAASVLRARRVWEGAARVAGYEACAALLALESARALEPAARPDAG
jgi:hypothetical protein